MGHASFTVNGRSGGCRGFMGAYYGQQLQSLRVKPVRQRIAERLTPSG